MRNRLAGTGDLKSKASQRSGWDLLLREQELKRKAELSRRDSQRHMSLGIGHHLPRAMKGHV